MSIRTCPRCGRLTLDEDRQRNEWRCTVRSCNYWEPVREPIIRSAEHLRAENIQLRQQLADVETGNLTVAIQEAAELRDQRDALMLRLQASEQQRFRAEAQVRRVRSELDAIATVRDQSFSDVSEANERASHEVLAHVNEITEMLFGPQAHAVGEEPRAAQGIGIFARALDVQRTLQEINMALVALAERIKSGA